MVKCGEDKGLFSFSNFWPYCIGFEIIFSTIIEVDLFCLIQTPNKKIYKRTTIQWSRFEVQPYTTF